MKILVYGAGVLGSYLAHTLMQAENEVFMLARGERYKQLDQDGLVIQHFFQRKKTVDKINLVRSLEASDYYDIIFVVMQYHQFQSVLPVLAANVSENIALVGNNADAESMCDFLIKNSTTKKKVAFGFQTSAGMRTDTGTVISIHGGGNVLAGELGDTMETFPVIKKAFGEKYKVTYQKNIDAWLKSHYIMILPMNSTYYLFNNDFKKVSKDKHALKRMIEATDEGFSVLERLGYTITPATQAKLFRQYKGIYYLAMKIYHKLPMSRVVQGTFDEMNGLYEAFDKMKTQTNYVRPVWDALQKEAMDKYYLQSQLPRDSKKGAGLL